MDTQINKPTNLKLNKSPQSPQPMRESYYKSLGTSVIKNPMSPSSLFNVLL